MLAVAYGLPIAESESATLETQRENLLEVFIRLFATRLLEAARRGLPHRCRLLEDDLRLLRGKLDIRRQLTRHALRPDRLACRFDELSVDTPLNRVLKATVKRLPKPGVFKRWRVPDTTTPFDVVTVDIGTPQSVRSLLRETLRDPTRGPEFAELEIAQSAA